jgi:DNA-binding CsgD family transcriptional regulator
MINNEYEEWTFLPKVLDNVSTNITFEDFISNNKILLTILDTIQDGISILSPNLYIKYANQAMIHWYNTKHFYKNIKCYKFFHNRNTICKNCPTMRCLHTKKPQQSTVDFYSDNTFKGYLKLYSVPIIGKDGNVMFVIEYIRNISLLKSVERNLQDLKIRYALLMAYNNLLTEQLHEKNKKIEEIELTIQKNIDKYIKPYFEYLKQKSSKEDIKIISSMIKCLSSPLSKKTNPLINTLSSREREVAMLIKDGYSSKQIAAKLFISKRAVDSHRQNIRKKLKLSTHENLQSYLKNNLQ